MCLPASLSGNMIQNNKHFKFVTKEIAKEWEKSGKAEIISKCEHFISAQKRPVEVVQGKDVRRILYEVVRQVLAKCLKNEQLVGLISALKVCFLFCFLFPALVKKPLI
uniref:uncharacterized protein LOC120340378 n=1 Tax=Styela clava TaxID=7725 RepID=UPI00193ACC47|nr:uncharacterized protein LOC120340378 [Styela clava]